MPQRRDGIKALEQFLETYGFEDKFIKVLVDNGIVSLKILKTVKEDRERVAALKTAIAAAGIKNGDLRIDEITVPQIDEAIAALDRDPTPAPEPDPKELQYLETFLKKSPKHVTGLMPILKKFGVHGLRQLYEVKNNSELNAKLGREIEASGIIGAKSFYDSITTTAINDQIAANAAAEAESGKSKPSPDQEKLEKAITAIDSLRAKIAATADAKFDSVRKEVVAEHDAVLAQVKEIFKFTDFATMRDLASASKADLLKIIDGNRVGLGSAKDILSRALARSPLSPADLVSESRMWLGYCVTPERVAPAVSDLVKIKANQSLPPFSNPSLSQYSTSETYSGSRSEAAASSFREATGTALSVAAQASGGTGLYAVSAAGSYAQARRDSTERDSFATEQETTWSQSEYIFVPKKAVSFSGVVELSDAATAAISRISALPDTDRPEAIKRFFNDFGSHFFQENVLGGRYQFTATGKTSVREEKTSLAGAIAKTVHWATNTSASYRSLTAAASGGVAVEGATSSQTAGAESYLCTFNKTDVRVHVEVLGGAGIIPRDLWIESLDSNTTWRVIMRDRPIAVWEMIRRDLPKLAGIADKFESVWVREVFGGPALKKIYPALYEHLRTTASITTTKALDEAQEAMQEPSKRPIQIFISHQKSTTATKWPIISAGAAGNSKLKLIGGGAETLYDKSAGSLLTGSYPEENSWFASAKDHGAYHADTHVGAYAIYLYDPDDNWEVKRVMATTRPKASNRPTAKAYLPDGFTLTGGGAKVEWEGSYGQLLTECRPFTEEGGKRQGWVASAKDHVEPADGYITVWAIGIKARRGDTPRSRIINVTGAAANHPKAVCELPTGTEIIVGGGGKVIWNGFGGLMTRTSPDKDSCLKWYAEAKDHAQPDTITVTAYALALHATLLTKLP